MSAGTYRDRQAIINKHHEGKHDLVYGAALALFDEREQLLDALVNAHGYIRAQIKREKAQSTAWYLKCKADELQRLLADHGREVQS